MSSYQICHVEIRTRNVERAVAFYRDAFGWKATVVPAERYAFADTGKTPLIGLMETANDGVPLGVAPYLLTEDVDGDLARVERAGGQVLLGKTAWGDLGWWGHTVDPWGNEVAFLQSRGAWAPSFKGDKRHPLVWAELRAPDLAAAVRYYKQVAGWSFQIQPDVDDFAFLQGAGHAVGVGLVGGERASALKQLTVYASVDDLGDACAAVVAAGGSVSQQSKAAPARGRIRIAYDPDGNAIGLFQERAD